MSSSPESGNHGVIVTGGSAQLIGNAIGPGAQVHNIPSADAKRPVGQNADIGVITVISVEMNAVVEMLHRVGRSDYAVGPSGRAFHLGTSEATGRPIRIVVTQALDRGQRSVIAACEEIRERYAPRVIVLLGIAGGLHPTMEIGDVAVVTEMIYYDARKVTAAGDRRRGEARPIPPWVRHRVNDFFATVGEPAWFAARGEAGGERFKAQPGPIGSGEAVVADAGSDIRTYLRQFNDKTLAVDTETGGLAQYLYERSQADATLGWTGIRGISDRADEGKDDASHALAAANAAEVLERMVPFLAVNSDA